MYCYTVRCEISNPDVARRWLSWLETEHIADVINAGATGAEIVAMTEQIPTWEIRYRFASRDEFDRYISYDAPRLRDEGLRQFPLELGLTYSRMDGAVVFAR